MLDTEVILLKFITCVIDINEYINDYVVKHNDTIIMILELLKINNELK